MTRFQMEFNGSLGAFWAEHAKQEIAKMQERADNEEIRTNMNGAAFWNSNGNCLPDDAAEILSYTDFPFSLEETKRARKLQSAMFLERYQHTTTTEEKVEMEAAFGKGATIMNVITGERISL